MRDLIFRKKTTLEFLELHEGIATNILTDRLNSLKLPGIVAKQPYQTRPMHCAYESTIN